MSKHHLRIIAIAILAVVAIFVIAEAQTVLAQEEPLCEGNEDNGCDYNGCEDTHGYCFKVYPSSPCLCGYNP
jgi:hypothetical protein